MFSNIGGKIKGLAKLFCWIGIVACVIVGGIMCGDEDTIAIGVICMLVGSVLSWIGSFVLYGFGELIEATTQIRYLVDKNSSQLHASYVASQKKNEMPSSWKCAKCGQENSNISAQCKGCGQYRS